MVTSQEILDVFAERFKQLLKDKDLDLQKLSNNIGIARSTLNDWKLGKKMPGADGVRKISDYFNVTTDYLLGKSDFES
ncbi:MAG: helix-turn-helix transcriptional regulator [Clostridiales bacterium]|nr:helix-turn-helix transcriptional regulator [Clostridiales bacterium]